MTSDPQELLRKLERENGAPVSWRTYAFLMVPGGGRSGSIGGLLYIAGERIVFEDFEAERPVYSLFIRRRSEYKKYKISAPISSVRGVTLTSQEYARQVLKGRLLPGDLPALNRIQRFFGRTIHMILFDDGSAWFCEIYDRRGLEQYLKEHL